MDDNQKKYNADTAEPDEERCENTFGFGQCGYTAAPGKRYCPMCLAKKEKPANAVAMYNLGKVKDRHNHFLNHDQAKTLSQEIGLLRILIEDVLAQANAIEGPNGMAVYAAPMSDLIGKLSNLLCNDTKLNAMLGRTMNREEVKAMQEKMVGVIRKHVTDPLILQAIAREFQQIANDGQELSKQRSLDEKG